MKNNKKRILNVWQEILEYFA